MQWSLIFIAQQEDIGSGVMGYKLGPSDLIVRTPQVTELMQVGANHLFVYVTNSGSLANQVKDWTEFRGFGYIDAAWRVALGIGSGTLNELKYMTGAHWYTGGEWHFGSIKDWEDAGSPSQVWFDRYRGILGVDTH